MITIILNEWKALFRNKILLLLSLLFLIGLSIVSWLGIVQNQEQQLQQQAAHEHVRAQWESIDAMNPHGAAHYGSYAFKPITLLSSIDEGVNAVTGNVLRLEGHVQNEMAYSEASQSLSISKFGKLKPALLLQFVIPLLLIFLSFASITSEKELGRLKLLVFQGSSVSRLIFAKSLSVWFYGILLLFITLLFQVLINLNNITPDTWSRTGFIFLGYTLYYLIIATLTTYLSARFKSNTAALTSMLAIWILWTIFLPSIWGNTTSILNPLPTKQQFKTAMKEDRSKGLDGHNPSDKRTEELETKILAQYKVDSLSQLPINFDGLLMQADEDYGNQVWDKHFGRNYSILQKQKQLYQLSGVFNPFASLQNISMGYSGSDMLHHHDFLRQAEDYRRYLIKTLNDKHTYGGSKTGDWNWEAGKDFYLSIKDFDYEMPLTNTISGRYLIDLVFLFLWATVIILVISFTSKKINLL